MKALIICLLCMASTGAFAQAKSSDCEVAIKIKGKGSWLRPGRVTAIRSAATQALREEGISVVTHASRAQTLEIDVCPTLFRSCDHVYVDRGLGLGQSQTIVRGTDDTSTEGIAQLAASIVKESVRLDECN